MLDSIKKMIDSSYRIAIIPHRDVDGDCLGSAYALKLILMKYGKNVSVLLNSKTCSNIFEIMYNSGNFENDFEFDNEIYDLAIAVDCADLGRLGDRQSFF